MSEDVAYRKIVFLPNGPILYSYVGGATGKALEKLPPEKVLTAVMQTLRSTFGATVPDPVFFYMTDWDADSFSYGSYSYDRFYGDTS